MASTGAKKDETPERAPDSGEVSSTGRAVRPSEINDAPKALAGKTIGRYRLLYPIAAGGMAQVWAAKPEGGGLSRTVALKLVRPEYAADEEYSRMFIDEAMVASSIHHPNVCEIYELGRDGDLLFMVLEWIAGDSLSGIMQRGTDLSPLAPEIAARITADACAGLHAAHEAVGPDGQPLGIVHRDVSPPNILISLHGHVKVSDFGIAKARHQLHSRTRTGEIKGKFAYIPPEQILGKGVDRRADVYAMGCVLYVASTGLRPFGGGATALGKIVQGKYRRPRELQSEYPEELEAIVVKALAANPANRYSSAEEMRAALEQWLLSTSRLVVTADVARVVRDRMNPERRRLVEAVLSSSRALPESIAYSLLASQQDKTHTPTATGGVVAPPPARPVAPRPGTERPRPIESSIQEVKPQDPEATVIGRHDAVPSATEEEAEERTRLMPPRAVDLSSCVPPPAEGMDRRTTTMEEATLTGGHERSAVRPSLRALAARFSSAAAKPASTDSAAAPPEAEDNASPQPNTEAWVWWMLAILALLAASIYTVTHP